MSLVGIAILPGNIYIVQLQKRKNVYALMRVCHERLPLEVFNQGKIVAFDLLTQCLREIVKREGIAGMQVATCVSAECVLLQRMRMPAGLTDDEVYAEIAAEVQKHESMRREKMTMDFQIQKVRSSEQMEVVFAVTPEEYIAKYTASLSMAGMRVAIMDLDAFVLQRVLSQNIDKIAMLYVSKYTAIFVIIDADENLLYRRWEPGQMSCEAWLLQCALLCQQKAIVRVALGMDEVDIDVEKIGEILKIDIDKVNPFTEIQAANIMVNPSAFWLAYGLAMRSALPWLS